MEIPLSVQMKRYISRKVKSGEFTTPQDVVRAGLAKMMQQDTVEQMSVAELKSIFPDFYSQIARGLADARAGRLSDGEAFFDGLHGARDIGKLFRGR